MNPTADSSYPVSLILGRTWRQSGRWRYPNWQVLGVLPYHTSPYSGKLHCRHAYSGENSEHFLWSGFWLEFFRDGLPGYYQNLTGKHPSLFVLCHSGDSDDYLSPVSISANHADAEAHLESDGIVLETPLIAPFSNWVADYVLANQSLFERQLAEFRQAKKGKRRHV